MALLVFPSGPVNGQLYPTAPLPGQNQYQWNSADQTWRLLGAATGVTPGTYGNATNVGQFTVDSLGRITFAQNVPIPPPPTGTVTSITAGVGLTGGTITTSGTIGLSNTGVTPGSYVRADITIDAQGRITLAADGPAPTLDSVTDVGNTTSNSITVGSITVNGLTYPGVSGLAGQALVADGAGGFTWNDFLPAVSPAVVGVGNTLTFGPDNRISFDSDTTNTNVITLQGPVSIPTTTNYVLPVDGTTGQVLQTDGFGVLSWLTIPKNIISDGNSSVVVTDTGFGEINFNVDGNTAASVAPLAFTLRNWREFRLSESLANGTNYVGFQAPAAVGSNVIWTLPAADGTNTQVLQTNGAGLLSWRTIPENSISQGNSSITVIDAGTGRVEISLDGNPVVNVLPEGIVLENEGQLRFKERTINGLQYVGFRAPISIPANVMWTLPPTDGLPNQVLSTNGAPGNTLSWMSVAKIVPPPTSSASPGARGEISYDVDYFYFFDGVRWLRIQGSTF